MSKGSQTNHLNNVSAFPPRARPGRWFSVVLIVLPLAAFSAIFFAPTLGGQPEVEAAAEVESPALLMASSTDRETAFFPICSGGRRVTCVVDGDTIWYRGDKIRLVGFDTPEISNPGCANERQLGQEAKFRLQTLLNAGPFTLGANPEGRSVDAYGRRLLVVSRGGRNLGDVLIAEGLAERRGGRRNVWC